jgi:hypothetical protein
MKKTNLLVVAVIAAATVIAAGLAVLPSSVQDAQADSDHCDPVDQAITAEFIDGDVFNEYECETENIGSVE